MKRTLIITIGILIILSIMGLWGYLMLYGAPKETQEVFTNLGIISKPVQEVRIVDPETQGKIQSQLGLTGSNLQQLTTRAVAGFTFASSSPHIVRYAERGTGHVFEIDLKTGKEEQISLTTIPQVVEAVFSPEGTSLAFTVYEGYAKRVSVASINKADVSITPKSIPLNAENIVFKDEQNINFTVENASQTIGYSYNLGSTNWLQVFTIPFVDVTLQWGKSGTKTIVQTKPASGLEGYMYSLSGNILTPLPYTGYGLTSFGNATYTLVSEIKDKNYISTVFTVATSTVQPILMLKEKCVFDISKKDAAWCATPLIASNASYLEDWYKGAQTSNDYLWYTELKNQSATLVGDLPELAGKTIDVVGLTINNEGTKLLFSNKIDQTLWMYKIVR